MEPKRLTQLWLSRLPTKARTPLRNSPVRVLLVDDSDLWRQFVSVALQSQTKFQVIREVSDGAGAVQQARQLQPDLIILDIGLPHLNGLEAARLIRKQAPESRILFLSQDHSWDIVEAALQTGAVGYVVKAHAGKELMPAVESVLGGQQFVSAGVSDHVYA